MKGNSFVKLIASSKKFLPRMILVVLLCVVSVCLTVFGTGFLSDLTNIVDEAASADTSSVGDVLDMSVIEYYCVILLIMWTGAAVCNYVQAFLMAGVTQGVSKKLRGDLALKTDRLPISYFDSRQTGDTLSRLTNDVDTVAQSLQNGLSTALSAVVQLALVTVVMLLTNWQMSLTAFATVPLSLLVMAFIVKVSQKYFRRQQKELGAMNGTAEECYSAMEVVHSCNAQDAVKEKFSKRNDRMRSAQRKANIISGISYPMTTFVSKLGYVAICVVGGILMSQGKTDLGTLAAFLLYISLFQTPLSQLGQIITQFQQASAAADRVFEYLEAEEQEDESGKETYLDPETVRGDVTFSDVCFGYTEDAPVIRNFSASVKAGQKVAIVGPTGAGKTTLVNLLMRFYETGAGIISVDGVPVSSLRRENVREFCSMVLQDPWLFEGTVRENLVFSREGIPDEQLIRAEEDARIRPLILSLPEGENAPVTDEGLSGGQKQLFTIARAMLKDSPIMILDEATSNVDTFTEREIQEAMDRLCSGRTSFVIAHRLSTIRNADLILVLKDGNIVEQGKHEELLALGGFYEKLYKSQFAGAG